MMATSLQAKDAEATAKVERVESPGGIEAYLISEPSIPFMSMSFRFKGGSVADPDGKEGLAYFASGLLDEGAGDLDSEAFRTELEDLAIRLSYDTNRDSFTGQLRTLTENRARAFELLRLSLTAPRFDEEPVERIKSQIQANLRRQSEDPSSVASRAWFENAFEGHPYSRPVEGEVESLDAIEKADLVNFTKERLAKDNLLIGVAGDITPEALGPLLDQAFGDLPAKSVALEIEETTPKGDGLVLIKKEVPQSQVLFGQKGLPRADPDFYTAYVVNHMLGGGGFTSRLTQTIREDRGLAYSVYSYLYPIDHAPTWLGGLGTSNASTSEAISLVQEQIRSMADGEIEQAELDDAKTYMTGSFPLRLTSNDRIANMLVTIQADNLGIDYLDRRNGFIEAVTLEDVKRVAARLLDPASLLTVVVGDPPDIEG